MQSYKAIVVLMLALASNVFAAQWYEAYEKALKALENEQWQQAIVYLNQAIAERPEPRANAKTYGMRFIDYLPYLYRGIAYHYLGDDDSALQDLQKSQDFGEARKARRDKQALHKLQTTLARINDELHDESKPDVQAMFAEAVSHFGAEDYEGARKRFDAVLKMEPNHAEARSYLDKLDRQVARPSTGGDDQSGAERYNQPGSLAGPSRESTAKRAGAAPSRNFTEGLRFFELGELQNAKKKFKRVRRTESAYAEAVQHLKVISEVEAQVRDGIVAFFDGDYERCISQLTQVLERYRGNAKIHAFLACAYASRYLLSGEKDQTLRQQAIDNFNAAKELDASYPLNARYLSPRIIEILENP